MTHPYPSPLPPALAVDTDMSRPKHSPCLDCSEPIAWTWFDRARVTPRWLPPEHERCARCQPEHAAVELESMIWQRARRSGVPEKYLWHSFARRRAPNPGEHLPAFVASLRRLPKTLGVVPSNQSAVDVLSQWRPSHGSVWLEGPPGTGKTLLLLAVVRDLLAEPQVFERIERPGRTPAVRISGGTSAHYTTEEQLYSDQRQQNKRDRLTDEANPIESAMRTGVLVLDDLGAVSDLKDWCVDLIQRLLDYRYRNARPVLLGTNLNPAQVRDRYGDRAASRLLEMVGGRRAVLGRDVPWRQIEGTL